MKNLFRRLVRRLLNTDRHIWYEAGRQSGRTARLVDQHIQTLYREGEVVPYDHYPSRKADEMMVDRVMRRIHSEHSLDEIRFTNGKILLLR